MAEKVKVYSNKIFDPRSQAVHHLDSYFICKRKNGAWHMVEGSSQFRVEKALAILVEHDVKHGHATAEDWMSIERERVEILNKMEMCHAH
ncbi:MAG: hypothetical protein JEZ11_13135 [Desulfobacterales bacterium]|nr:hypothetical protein [Desulfobacterales bacterium]